MPTVAIISGVKICVYSNDHVPPHIHAFYGEFEALIDIRALSEIKGKLPKNKLKIAIKFIKESQNELLELFYELNPHISQI